MDDAGSFGDGYGTFVVGLAFSHSGMHLESSYHDFQAPISRVEAAPGHFPGVLGLWRVVIPPSAFSQPDQGSGCVLGLSFLLQPLQAHSAILSGI